MCQKTFLKDVIVNKPSSGKRRCDIGWDFNNEIGNRCQGAVLLRVTDWTSVWCVTEGVFWFLILLQHRYFTRGFVSGTRHSKEAIINMKSKLDMKEQPFDSMRTECTVAQEPRTTPLQLSPPCSPLAAASRALPCAEVRPAVLGPCCPLQDLGWRVLWLPCSPALLFFLGKQSCEDSWERLCVPEWLQRSSITSGLQWVPWGKSHPYWAAAGAGILFCGSLVSVKILVSNLVKDVKNVGCKILALRKAVLIPFCYVTFICISDCYL